MYHLLAIGLVSAALFLSVALVTLACIKLCWRRRNSDDLERGTQTAKIADCPETPNAHPTDAKVEVVQRFAWAEIESLTNNFAPGSLIGEGGFSSVYLARLPFPSAIKVHHSSKRLHRAFREELDVLLHLRHPHIVRLLGYSDDHPDDGALVFEYVPGGTLNDRLHGGPDTVVLPWARRMSIAQRLAEAVAYLHEVCDPQVMHGDIKAANVLLDGRMDPKLCDFGSATMGFSATVRSSVAEKPTMVGSPGYVDPHYLRTGIVSKKSDVYSFGVLLLELVTGDEAFCSGSERSLMATIGLMLREGRAAAVVVDARLGSEYDATEAAVVIEVAGQCVGERPSLRPSMVEVLRAIRDKVTSASISAAGEDRLDCRPDL